MFNNLVKHKNINKILLSIISVIYCFNSKKCRKLRYEIKKVYKNNKKQEIANLIREKYSDYYCVFSRYGIGDIFFIASLINAFKKKNGGKVAYFTEKKGLVEVLKAFPSIDEVIFDKDLSFLQEEQNLQQHLQIGKLHKLFFPYRGTKETYTFSDNYNNLLDLPLDADRELPIISEKNYLNAKNEFKKLKINPHKVILIIPDAAMFDYRVIDSKFWMNLAKKLESSGFDVVFNTKLDEYKHFKNTFLPVMDFVAFAKQIKHIISFRSGVCDLLAGLNSSNLTTIYPPNLEVIWADAKDFNDLHKNHVKQFDNEFDNMFSIHSLNKTFKRADIQEIIYDYDDSKISDYILERINNVGKV